MYSRDPENSPLLPRNGDIKYFMVKRQHRIASILIWARDGHFWPKFFENGPFFRPCFYTKRSREKKHFGLTKIWSPNCFKNVKRRKLKLQKMKLFCKNRNFW